jgi:hypothetical protein
MFKEEFIQKIVEECRYMWEQPDRYALLRMETGYLCYDKINDEIGGTEIEEANQRIWANMIAAGCDILDELPEQREPFTMDYRPIPGERVHLPDVSENIATTIRAFFFDASGRKRALTKPFQRVSPAVFSHSEFLRHQNLYLSAGGSGEAVYLALPQDIAEFIHALHENNITEYFILPPTFRWCIIAIYSGHMSIVGDFPDLNQLT